MSAAPNFGPWPGRIVLAISALVAMSTGAWAQSATAPAIKPTVVEAPAAPAEAAQTAAANPAAPPGAAAKNTPKKPATGQTAVAKPDGSAASKRKSSHSIVVLVGDDPITGYEIEQRQRLLAQGSGVGEQAKTRFQGMIKSQAVQDRMKAIQGEVIKANGGKSREQVIALIKARMQDYGLSLQKQALEGVRASAIAGLKQKALDQLIDEKLMMQESKRLGVLASDDDVEKYITDKAARSKISKDEFIGQFKNMGIDAETMRQLYRAQISWLDAVRKRYGYEVRVTERDIDKVVAVRPGDGENDVELQLQRVTLPMPAKLDQKAMALRFQEAENIWSGFSGCESLAAHTAKFPGAKLENLGAKRPIAIGEPTRGLLLSAKDGEMLPPSVGSAGIELWAVCGRSVVTADAKQRQEVAVELRQQQYGLYADRFLKDLRKDTPIEYR